MEMNFELITKHLPEGWKERAKESKALERAGDYIKTPEELLKILLLWADMGSLGETSAFLKSAGEFPLNKNALFERVGKSADWLEWLAKSYCFRRSYLTEKPDWLKDYERVLLADMTRVCKTGKRSAEYHLHCVTELFTLERVEQILTDRETGESARNFSCLKKGDLLVGDRAYGTLRSVQWARAAGADYLFRWKANSFTLYERKENGEFEEYDLASDLKDWEEDKLLDLRLYCRIGERMQPVRVCAKGKSKEAVEEGLRKIKLSNGGEKRQKISESQKIYNKFVVVITSLPETIDAGRVLELYRMRWQIEMVFKRMKSIFRFDRLLSRNKRTAKAYFYAVLLLAALCETFVQDADFSPCAPSPACQSRRSLWRELKVVFAALSALLREAFHFQNILLSPQNLISACSNSKRKRRPALVAFAYPSP